MSATHHHALIRVNASNEPALETALRSTGLPAAGVDRGYGIVAINSRQGIYCFRGHWSKHDLDVARERGVGVYADPLLSIPESLRLRH